MSRFFASKALLFSVSKKALSYGIFESSHQRFDLILFNVMNNHRNNTLYLYTFKNTFLNNFYGYFKKKFWGIKYICFIYEKGEIKKVSPYGIYFFLKFTNLLLLLLAFSECLAHPGCPLGLSLPSPQDSLERSSHMWMKMDSYLIVDAKDWMLSCVTVFFKNYETSTFKLAIVEVSAISMSITNANLDSK